MIEQYSYLKPYTVQHDHIVKTWCENSFFPVTQGEIIVAEKRLGYALPRPLVTFWLEIGCGYLTTPHCAPVDYECEFKNRVLSPDQVADIILLKEDSGYILPEVPMFEGAIPFFEIADMYDFFVMSHKSVLPNAVYDQYGDLIEESFEKFIWRLYYESPTYYLDINKDEYQEEQRKEQLRKIEIERKLQAGPARGILWEYINHNYHQILREKGLYEEFTFGGEPIARKLYEEFKGRMQLNHCPNCGNLKKTPKARQCLKCGEFHDPELV